MMRTYLGSDAEGLDGFEFLTMAEAGEVGHWEVLGVLGEKAGRSGSPELVEWAVPIQERHFRDAREASLKLAAGEDPNAELSASRSRPGAGSVAPRPPAEDFLIEGSPHPRSGPVRKSGLRLQRAAGRTSSPPGWGARVCT